MSAAQNRFKQANAPLGGQRGHVSAERGGCMSAAQNRFKQANAPLGGSEDTPVPSVGAA